MKHKSTLRTCKSVAVVIGLVLNICVLAALLLFLVASPGCTATKPKPAYYFKPGPAYGPGRAPYKGVHYPNHP